MFTLYVQLYGCEYEIRIIKKEREAIPDEKCTHYCKLVYYIFIQLSNKLLSSPFNFKGI